MQIVVVDGQTLNPGDLSWDELRALGDLTLFPRTKPNEIVNRCKNASIVLTNKVPFRKEILDQLSDLSYIGVTATGYDIIDIDDAKNRGITVTNVPAYGADSVAQHTFALLLELTNHVGLHTQSTANGEWSSNLDWSYSIKPLKELSGKTMGLIGLGNIGIKTARIAQAFNMHVIAHKKHMEEEVMDIELVSLNELLSESDVVSLHLPLTEDSFHLINQGRISLMKKSALLLNTSRGNLIDSNALAIALQEKHIAGAALDVLPEEPPSIHHPLLKIPNCLITPHLAWASVESRSRLLKTSIQNLQAFLIGKPVNVIT